MFFRLRDSAGLSEFLCNQWVKKEIHTDLSLSAWYNMGPEAMSFILL